MTTPHKMLIIIIFMLHFDHEYFPGEGILKIERIFFITNHFKRAIKVLCIETIFVSFLLCIRTMHNYIAFGFFVVHKLILFSIFFNFQHRIPKEYHDRDPRINLTFRVIYPK